MLPNNIGLLTCSRYAFAPNFYQYCGPDKNKTLEDYLKASESDIGLKKILVDFETLYSYLKFIAWSNRINNPFDEKVVEAYWLGNGLLENIRIKDFYRFLQANFAKKIPKKILDLVYPRLDKGARVNHAFHVLSLWRRTGHVTIDHTLKTMDNCRIGWGKVVRHPEFISGSLKMLKQVQHDKKQLIVKTRPLIYQNNKLILGKPIEKEIIDQFNLSHFLKPGDWVSYHWGFLCDKLILNQLKNLHAYTQLSIKLANLNL
jgi:hypothetical protein